MFDIVCKDRDENRSGHDTARPAPDLVYCLDKKGRINFINNAISFYGMTKSELLGRNIMDLVHPDDQDRARFRLNERRTGDRRTQMLEIRLMLGRLNRKSICAPVPRCFHVEAEGIYLSKRGKSEWVGTKGTARAISRPKHWDERLAQRLSLRDRIDVAFRAGMAEISAMALEPMGNLLNNINTSGQLIRSATNAETVQHLIKANRLLADLFKLPELKQHAATADRLLEYYRLIEKEFLADQEELRENAMSLIGQVNTIKGMVGLQEHYASQRNALEKAPVVVILENALALLEADNHGLAVIERDFHDHPSVLLPANQVIHVLINLLHNARDAVYDKGPDGVIRVACQVSDEQISILVEDNGNGIHPNDLPQLFAQGFSTKPGGHGFGLHGCARTLVAMNGRLVVESEGPQKGARFTVVLPRILPGE